MNQPTAPRPDPQAEPQERTAWNTATHHAAHLTPTHPGPAAQVPLTTRAQHRLARGTGRIWTRTSAFVRGDDLDLGEKAGRWFTTGIAAFVIEQTLTTTAGLAGVSLAGGTAAWIAAAWLYGGPHGEHAVDALAPADQPATGHTGVGPAAQLPAATPDQPVPGARTPVLPPVLSPEEEAAREALQRALAAPKVGLGKFALVDSGGFIPPHGQRWILRMQGGATVGDVIGKLENLESAWQVPRRRSVLATPAPGGADLVEVKRLDIDPLDRVPPLAAHTAGAVSIREPFALGHAEDGTPDRISLLRRHVGVIAANGAGKSTLQWTLLARMTACCDVVYWLIDLQGSAALRTWESCAGRTAYDLERARFLLRAAFAFAQHRAAGLGENATAFIDSDDEDLDVNHEPTPDDPALILVIEEGSLLADDPECVELILKILRTGRKAAVTLVYVNQRGTDRATGSASIRKEFVEKIMMRCEGDDVDLFLGEGMRAKGWLPDLITLPGVYYRLNVVDDPNPTPRRCRTSYATPAQVKPAIRAARTTRPHFPRHVARALPYALETEDFDQALDALTCQMAARGEDRIATGELAARLANRDPHRWAQIDVLAQLRTRGQHPQQSMRLPGGEKGNGYLLTQLTEGIPS